MQDHEGQASICASELFGGKTLKAPNLLHMVPVGPRLQHCAQVSTSAQLPRILSCGEPNGPAVLLPLSSSRSLWTASNCWSQPKIYKLTPAALIPACLSYHLLIITLLLFFSRSRRDRTHVDSHASVKQEAFTSFRAVFPERCDKDVVWVGFLMITGTLLSHPDLTWNTLEKHSANAFILMSAKCFLPCIFSQHPTQRVTCRPALFDWETLKYPKNNISHAEKPGLPWALPWSRIESPVPAAAVLHI